MNGKGSSALGFLLFAYCCISLQPPLPYVNQPKHFSFLTAITWLSLFMSRAWPQEEYNMVCWRRKQPLEGYAEGVSLQNASHSLVNRVLWT